MKIVRIERKILMSEVAQVVSKRSKSFPVTESFLDFFAVFFI